MMHTNRSPPPKIESNCDLRLLCFILGCYQILVTTAETSYQLNGINFKIPVAFQSQNGLLACDLIGDAATIILTIILLGSLFSKTISGIWFYLKVGQVLIAYSVLLTVISSVHLKSFELYAIFDLVCLCLTWSCAYCLHHQWKLKAELLNKTPKTSKVYLI